jgi:diadenosine tetraphosphate (Ap4A) HIT family hydrolase
LFFGAKRHFDVHHQLGSKCIRLASWRLGVKLALPLGEDGMAEFSLDTRLASDTAFVCEWVLSNVYLINDRRYAWLVLVPRRGGVVEPFDLAADEQALLWREAMRVARLVKQETACAKVNVGALGNVVAQLHVHVVARNPGDAAWPGPVWGHGTQARFETAALEAEVARWRTLLRPPTD